MFLNSFHYPDILVVLESSTITPMKYMARWLIPVTQTSHRILLTAPTGLYILMFEKWHSCTPMWLHDIIR